MAISEARIEVPTFASAGRMAVGITFVTLGLAYGFWYAYSVFFVAFLREFGWSRSVVAGAFSVLVLVHGVSGPCSAGWSSGSAPGGDRHGRGGARRAAPRRAVNAAWQLYLAIGVLAALGCQRPAGCRRWCSSAAGSRRTSAPRSGSLRGHRRGDLRARPAHPAPDRPGRLALDAPRAGRCCRLLGDPRRHSARARPWRRERRRAARTAARRRRATPHWTLEAALRSWRFWRWPPCSSRAASRPRRCSSTRSRTSSTTACRRWSPRRWSAWWARQRRRQDGMGDAVRPLRPRALLHPGLRLRRAERRDAGRGRRLAEPGAAVRLRRADRRSATRRRRR